MNCLEEDALSVVDYLSTLNERNCKNSLDKAVFKAQMLNTILVKDMSNNLISNGVKKIIITRLQKLLSLESAILVQAVTVILIKCTEDLSCDEELTSLLMQQAFLVLNTKGNILDGRTAAILEMLTNLVIDSEENQAMLKSSRCLSKILDIFRTFDFEDTSNLPLLNDLVNVMIAATCIPINNSSKKFVCNEVVLKAVKLVQIWTKSSVVVDTALKEVLFLCANLLSCSEACQNALLKNQGLETFKRALDLTDLMEEHMEKTFPSRKSLLLDHSQTLFSSVVTTLDVAVTHNTKVSQKALELGLLDTLEQLLGIAPLDQKGSIISCLVHLLEENNDCADAQRLLIKMYEVVHGKDFNTGSIGTPVIEYINQRNVTRNKPNKISIRKGTPHPRKFQITGREIPKRSNMSRQVSKLSVVSHSLSKSPTKCKVATSKSSTSEKRTDVSRYFINTAELVVFLKCVKLHGVNMQAVRKLFPFHKTLTAGDLYALWRSGIWKKKLYDRKQY